MIERITIRTPAPRPDIEGRLRTLTASGPFRIRDLSPRGKDEWLLTLEPARPALALGFGKVAELLVLLSRECDVLAIERTPGPSLAAAG